MNTLSERTTRAPRARRIRIERGDDAAFSPELKVMLESSDEPIKRGSRESSSLESVTRKVRFNLD